MKKKKTKDVLNVILKIWILIEVYMVLIGISGLYQAGKDTIADYLVDTYGFVKLPMAWALKNFCRDFFGVVDKTDIKQRKILQQVGTEKARSIHPDFWVYITGMFISLLLKCKKERIVIPDCRYLNEFNYIKEHYGYTFLVERNIKRSQAILSHATEKFAKSKFLKKNANFLIDNNMNITDLYTNIDVIITQILHANKGFKK